MEFTETDTQELENLKSKFEELKDDLFNYITDKFDDVFTAIDHRIEELEDEDEDEDEDEEEYEVESVDTSVQAKINQSLLSQKIANQLQTVPAALTTEELPVVQVVNHPPAPSLSDLIKNQVSGEAPAAVETPVNLSSLIGGQISAQKNLTVIAPVQEATEPVVEVEAPARPLGAIIAELRSDINAQVDAVSEAATSALVEQAAAPHPDIDSDHTQGLASQIRTQLLSSTIKKQLS